MEQQADLGDEAFGPRIATKRSTYAERHSTGQQQGAFTHKAAMAQLVSFQLSKDEHFLRAKEVGSQPTPLETTPVVDPDLRFAAEQMCIHYDNLEKVRLSNIGVMVELR